MIPGRMPSTSGRRALRRNLHKAQFHGGGESRHQDQQQQQQADYDYNGDIRRVMRRSSSVVQFAANANANDDNDTFRDDDAGYDDVGGKRASFAHAHAGRRHTATANDDDDDDEDCDSDDDKKDPAPRKAGRTSSLFSALSDPNSELARFLLTDDFMDDDDDDDDDVGLTSLFAKSVRNMATRFITGEGGANDAKKVSGSMGCVRAWFYSLALEPMAERKERIIMLAEAYAIFGALFLSGTWVLYEWGSTKGYGGCKFEDDIGCHPYVDRAFELVMAMTITANLFMAMFASFLWLMSVLFSGSIRSWVFSCRKILSFIITLLLCVLTLTILGVALGLFSKLAPYWIEFAIAFSFFLIIVVYGIYCTSSLIAEEIGLEYYHFPLWFKWAIPFPMLKRGYRKQIREAAQKRAKELRTKAYQERTMLDPNAIASSKHFKNRRSSVGTLLRGAADSIGRFDFDVAKYEGYLEEDWYNDADDLKDLGVEVLSKYMPRRLAQEVHNMLKLEGLNIRSSSIGSGVMFEEEEDDERERKISWNIDEVEGSD